MTLQETRDRIADEEESYFERRLEELSGQVMPRSELFAKINREMDDIRSRRNEP